MTTNVTHNIKSAELAAIEFAIRAEEGLEFLRCWQYGDFDIIRREWPDAPEAVFIGADPMHKPRGEAPEQSEPKGYLHYPPKKPELAVLSFQKEPITAHKARGYISEALYTHPAPKAEPVAYMVQFSPGARLVEITKEEFDNDVDGATVYRKQAFYTRPAPKAEPVNQMLLKALQAALEWIDAVPDDVVLPTMPGFDRDDVDALVAKAEQAPQPAELTDAEIGKIAKRYGDNSIQGFDHIKAYTRAVLAAQGAKTNEILE